MIVKTETCAGCGREIPSAETPYVWHEETLCKACWTEIVNNTRARSAELKSPPVNAAAVPGKPHEPESKEVARIVSPAYSAILVISMFMQVLGAIELLIGIGLVVVALQNQGMVGSASMMVAVSLIVSGVIVIAIGQALACLRDMAVNSFHVRGQLEHLNRHGN